MALLEPSYLTSPRLDGTVVTEGGSRGLRVRFLSYVRQRSLLSLLDHVVVQTAGGRETGSHMWACEQRAAGSRHYRYEVLLLAWLAGYDEHLTVAVTAAEQPPPQSTPGTQRLAGPDPHAGRDAYGERHEVLEHQDRVERAEPSPVRGYGVVARAYQRCHPVGVESRLVEVAADHGRRWQGIQHAEDSYSDHQLLQLIGFASSSDSTLLFDHVAYPEKRDEPAEKEGCPEHQVDKERAQHKDAEVVSVLVADVADPCDRVPVDCCHHQHPYRLHSGDEPSREVEVLGVPSDRFITPLQSSS